MTKKAIPKKIRQEMVSDPLFPSCMLYGQHGHVCDGRITIEHALIHAGRQLNKRWALINICAKAHEVDGFQDAHTINKEMNVWVALNQATDAELCEVSKAVDYLRERKRLNKIYGVYKRILPSLWSDSAIHYPVR